MTSRGVQKVHCNLVSDRIDTGSYIPCNWGFSSVLFVCEWLPFLSTSRYVIVFHRKQSESVANIITISSLFLKFKNRNSSSTLSEIPYIFVWINALQPWFSIHFFCVLIRIITPKILFHLNRKHMYNHAVTCNMGCGSNHMWWSQNKYYFFSCW